MSNRNITHESAIFGLWLNWIIAGGALFVPNIVSVYIAPIFTPIITYLLAAGLYFYNRSSLQSRTAVCPLLPSIAMRSLFISATVMVLISLIYRKGYITYFYDERDINSAIPFVTTLIISPVTFAITAWAQFRGEKYSACHNCRVALGPESERGFLGQLFAQESHYQKVFLLAISAVLSLVTWGYYTFFYINVNINVPDRFFFGWVPVTLFIISVFYLGARCFTIWAYYYQNIEGSDRRHGASTSLRVLIISGDSLYLVHDDDFNEIPDGNMYDTPATLTVHYTENLAQQRATRMMCDMSHMDPSDFVMRFMYASHEASGDRNTFHYICCPSSPEAMEKSSFNGEWYNLSQLERLLHNHELSPMLAAEIHRLYTVTMAWKTYDADGHRLYKVKNYHPLFRLNGICDWDVDFNSSHWLNVARLNEDKPFFRLRRLARRIFAMLP
ncbi:MAG: hypothetical protein NC349_05645 [Paenibacillus sp.]|nr:hypothetical protein [Paenibacillus sp.]